MAYIEKRGNSWRAQIRRKGAPTISRTFDLKTDAETWAREIEREHQRGNVAILRQEAQRTSVGDALDLYLAGPVKSMRSEKTRVVYLRRARERFGTMFLANIRGVDVAAWRDELSATGLAPQTVLHHLSALGSFFRYVERELSIELPAGNPVGKVRKPPQPRARERRLRPGELEALLRAAAAPRSAAGLPEIITLAIETSMRRGELIGLERSCIDLKRRVAHLRETKNGESRTVALSSAAVQALESLPRRIDGRVFAWKTPSGFETIWQRCVKRARREHVQRMLMEALQAEGLDAEAELRAVVYKKRDPNPRTIALLTKIECDDTFLVDLRFHDLRHEATSRLFEKGLGIMEVASMTGHKSLAMLKRYTHVEAERLAQKLG